MRTSQEIAIAKGLIDRGFHILTIQWIKGGEVIREEIISGDDWVALLVSAGLFLNRAEADSMRFRLEWEIQERRLKNR